MAAQQLEGPFHLQLAVLGEDARGLLDDDSAVQCQLQLLGQDVESTDGAFLQNSDGRRGSVRASLIEPLPSPSVTRPSLAAS